MDEKSQVREAHHPVVINGEDSRNGMTPIKELTIGTLSPSLFQVVKQHEGGGSEGDKMVMVLDLVKHGIGLYEVQDWMEGGDPVGLFLGGLMERGRLKPEWGVELMMKYKHYKNSNDKPKMVACSSPKSTDSLTSLSQSESSSVEGKIKILKLKAAEEARNQQGRSSGSNGRTKVNTSLVQQAFRHNLWPDFKFVFSSAEALRNSELAKAYYSVVDIEDHPDRFVHWDKAMPIGRRTMNEKRASVTGTMKDTFIRKLMGWGVRRNKSSTQPNHCAFSVSM
jgi:hypothetical protein